MTPEVYIAFVAAAALLIAAPGPSVMLIVSHAMGSGLKRSLFTIAGEATSHALLISITTLGLAPILMTSAQIFGWLKWIGAAYLIWMGIRQWRNNINIKTATGKSQMQASRWSCFFQGFTVNTTNPKALVFYAAFFPPFLSSKMAVIPQLIILGLTFLAIFLIISFFYALLADRTRALYKHSKHVRIQNRITGGLLVGAGVVLAAIKNK